MGDFVLDPFNWKAFKVSQREDCIVRNLLYRLWLKESFQHGLGVEQLIMRPPDLTAEMNWAAESPELEFLKSLWGLGTEEE